MQNKNILIYTKYFYPSFLAGGPVKSIFEIYELLIKNSYNVFVLTTNRDIDGTIVDEDNKIQGIYYDNKMMSFITLYKFLKNQDIKIVYLNSFFSFSENIRIFLLSYLLDFKIILAPRGQVMYGALKKRYKLKKIFLCFFKFFFNKSVHKFHFTSELEYNDFKKIYNYKEVNYSIIENISKFKIIDNYFDRSTKKVNHLSLVFFSRIVEKKNLIFLIQLLKDLNFNNLKFYIYGSIEDVDYWQKCTDLLSNSKIDYIYKGSLNPNIINETLNAYDLFVFPTFSENFGHVILEALSSGLPVLISDNTPFSIINKYKCGWAINLADENMFKTVINEFYTFDNSDVVLLKQNIKKFLIDYNLNTQKIEHKYKELFN